MKDKNTAALLAFLLGGFGAHKFYLGKTTEGWWYLAALIAGFWTVIIPIIILIVCLIDAIKLFSMDDDAFNAEYNKEYFKGSFHSYQQPQQTSYQQPRPQYTPTQANNSTSSSSSKPTKRCPYCGEEILEVAKKCKYCGEWLDKPQKVIIRCSICGEEADASLDICPYCGEKLAGRSF